MQKHYQNGKIALDSFEMNHRFQNATEQCKWHL